VPATEALHDVEHRETVAALLRAAMRIAGASAAIVALEDDPTPIAHAGYGLGAATLALRDGSGLRLPIALGEQRMVLVLVPAPESDTVAALDAVGRELAVALLEHNSRIESQLATLAATAEGVSDAVIVSRVPTDINGPARIAYVNGAFERLFGYTTADLNDHTDGALFTAASKESVSLVRERLAAGEPVRSIIVAMRTRDNEPLWVDMTARIARDDQDRATFYVFTLHDITSRRAFEATVAAEKQRLAVTLKAIGDAMITVLPDGRIDFLNAAAQRMLGVAATDAFNAPLRSVVNLRDDHGGRCEIALDPGTDVRGEGILQSDDRQLNIAFVSSPIVAQTGATLGFVIVLRDITAEARLTRRLAYEASHDPLTRLPNRRRFEEMIEAALGSARRNGTVHTVAYIDLDHFKLVNDTMGHQAGDKLLRELAHRMSYNVRGNDILARIGGDEFALLLHECTPANALRVAEKLRISVHDAAREIVTPASVATSVGASVGIAALDRQAASAAEVLAAADRACYAAKAAGRNQVVLAEDLTKGSD
jgi:diguanylate cyclase (GGDEF)-like protein/PAS domain S-box-containing protein